MKLSDEREAWLRYQLADKSECQLFNFGENKGFDIHGDVIDLLDDNTQLKEERNDYRNQYHMAEAKVLSRDALLEQLTEEQLTKDVAKAEAENEELKRENEALREAIGEDGLIDIADALLADTQESER